jgi:hypothetical protein
MPRVSQQWRHVKNFPTRLKEIAKDEAQGKLLEIWFCDEGT